MKKYVEYIKEFNKPWVHSIPDGTSKVKLFYFLEGLAKLVGEELANSTIPLVDVSDILPKKKRVRTKWSL